ncbi:hypothetical protein ACJW30_03G040200 [Castanea mollissima]
MVIFIIMGLTSVINIPSTYKVIITPSLASLYSWHSQHLTLQASHDNALSIEHTNFGKSENFDAPGFVPILVTTNPQHPAKKEKKRNTCTCTTCSYIYAQTQGHAVCTQTMIVWLE